MKNFTVVLFLLFSVTLFAQNANIQVLVKDAQSKGNVSGATVMLENTAFGGFTDENGQATLQEVPAGTYRLITILADYNTDTLANVVLTANETKNITVNLAPFQLTGVVVTAQRITNTEMATIQEVKRSEQVIVAVSSQQIVKTQDRTASDVVKRIPGVTIMDDKFINVRGLAERYNSVLLNETFAPSLESDKKAFSFDMIPGGLIDRIVIYKSPSPELPGDFSGGAVKIHLKNLPDSNMVQFGYATSLRAGTTFQDFYAAQTSPTDFLGFDNGLRKLPNTFPNQVKSNLTQAETFQAAKDLPNNWIANKSLAIPDQRMNFLFGRRFEVKKAQVGTLTAVNYSNTSRYYRATPNTFNSFDSTTLKSEPVFKYEDDNYVRSTNLNILHNWSVILSENHKLEFRNLFTQMADDQTVLRTGVNYDARTEEKNYAFYYKQRTLYLGQLHGNHSFNEDRNTLKWSFAYSQVNMQEPDFRRIRTNRDLGAEENAPFNTYIPQSASALDAGRLYTNLNEQAITGKLAFEHKLGNKEDALRPKLRAGMYVENKDRVFAARWLSYSQMPNFEVNLLQQPINQLLSAENFNVNGLTLSEGTNGTDKYSAANFLGATYVSTSYPINTRWSVSGGVRGEFNNQSLQSRDYGNLLVNYNKPIFSVLPSFNLNFMATEKQTLRLSYGKTVNRPEFRELAPFAFYNFAQNAVIYGNPDLNIANIHNTEARWELYPSGNEIVSVGAFFKYFNNPIETYFRQAAAGVNNFSFDNAEFSTSTGAEIEVRKSFASMTENAFLQRISWVMNAAYIYSRVNLGDKAVGQADKRPLMGQSPYLFNTGLFYQDTDHNFQVNLLYNVIGKRIVVVGNADMGNIYEMPRNVVDLNIMKNFGKHVELRFSAQDLLNAKVLLMQDADRNGKIGDYDEIINNYRKGQYFTLGVVLKY
ncbi:MAG: TonB-dependent receptor domain-containing protein [Bacteroidia bacterium]